MHGKVYQDIRKAAKYISRHIRQIKGYISIRRLSEHFENVKSYLNKQKKVQVDSSAYISSLNASPFQALQEQTACLLKILVGNTCKEAVLFIFYYGSTNSRFNSIIVFAGKLCANVARDCTRLKNSVWVELIFAFAQACKNYVE